jgi:NADP-dependent alcohol dehydrogenase
MFGIDPAQTLAVVLPSVWRVRKERKRAKLLQYAERVWDITSGDEDSRIEQAIAATQAFFEQVGLKTRLRDYDVPQERIADVVAALEAHGMTALSETGDLGLDSSREILELAW